MDVGSVRQIKLWILEHACKHRMEKVIEAVVEKDKKNLDLFCKQTEEGSQVFHLKVYPVFLFMLLVKALLQSFCMCLKHKDTNLCWDEEVLSLVIEVLDETYQQKAYISLKHFTNLITRLKLMELIRLLAEGVDSHNVVQKLNTSFPRWSANLKEKFQKVYNIKNSISLDKMQKSHIQCRRFILRLTISEECRNTYLFQSYQKDLKQFTTDSIRFLKEVVTALESKLGPSAIEQIVSGADEDLAYSDDPAIQILLEYLHSEMTENDFISLLHALEPTAASQMEHCMANCLGSLDVCSEVLSDLSDSNESEITENRLSSSSVETVLVGIDKECNLADVAFEEEVFSYNTDQRKQIKNVSKLHETSAESMEIVSDSEDEQPLIYLTKVDEELPNIDCHLLDEDIRPSVVKLYKQGIFMLCHWKVVGGFKQDVFSLASSDQMEYLLFRIEWRIILHIKGKKHIGQLPHSLPPTLTETTVAQAVVGADDSFCRLPMSNCRPPMSKTFHQTKAKH